MLYQYRTGLTYDDEDTPLLCNDWVSWAQSNSSVTANVHQQDDTAEWM